MAAHSPLENDVHSPLEMLHSFFDAYHLPDARQYLQGSVFAALSPAVWQLRQPANLLHFTGKMQMLQEAAYQLCEPSAQLPNAIIEAPKNMIPDVAITNNYTPCYSMCNAWGSFPRHLTGRQYHNPYKALEKFCSFQSQEEWSHFLQELLYHALSTDEITNAFEIPAILRMQKRLLQLVEACHLIEVRSTRYAANDK